jgi:hypothetical protein
VTAGRRNFWTPRGFGRAQAMFLGSRSTRP